MLSYYAGSLKKTKVLGFCSRSGLADSHEVATTKDAEDGNSLLLCFPSNHSSRYSLFDEPRGTNDGNTSPMLHYTPLFLQFAIIAHLQPLRGYDKDFKVSLPYLFSLQLSRTLIFSTTSALSPSFSHSGINPS